LGYCHYWGRPAELSLSGSRAFVQECVRLRRALGVPWLGLLGGEKIGNAFGQGRPMFREDVISCNGRPGHEPLIIHRLFHKPQQEPGGFGPYWGCVKTNQKPYDDLVVAVLVSFKAHFPGAALPSDRSKRDWVRDWARGIALYEGTTGRQAPGFNVLGAPQEAAVP
jgi:hypothetical protein